MKEYYSIKDYLLRPIVTKIDETENKLREEVMDYIIKNHKPFKIKNHPEAERLRELGKKNILAFNSQEEIVSIYPVSATPTNKKVIFDDGSYAYAMCAIDAIGFHYAFNKPITIESGCQHCDIKIKIRVEDGKVNVLSGDMEIHVLHTDLENKENWSCCCCNIMHFFVSEESLENWLKINNINEKVFSVNLETANKLAWLLFSK